MLDQPEPDQRQEKQRSRGRIAWMIGAPIGGLALGLMIAAGSLGVAEAEYSSVSTEAAVQVLNNPRVYETTTIEKTVTVHPRPESPDPEPAAVPPPTPASPGGKPDYGAPVRDYCKGRFPSASDLQAYNLCVEQTSGGTVKP